jgi:hypothetical protein
MNNLMNFSLGLVNTIFDPTMFSFISDGGLLSIIGSGVAAPVLGMAVPITIAGPAPITDGVMAKVRKWHGSIEDQFSNIDNLANTIVDNQPAWVIPDELLAQLTGNRSLLQTLINKCRSTAGSAADREQRNALLKLTVGLCLLQIRVWVYSQYTAGVISAEEVHILGFLLPGEHGGRHERTEATDIIAEVKVKVINEDFIHVVIDQSAGENAAQVVHGWPESVRNARIIITAADGKTEIYNQLTTRLHNDIRMPDGSHGKQFIIKAAFLKHINDEPKFGNEPTFSMPKTTEDLVATLDNQHHADYEEQVREVERQRQLVEQLQDELDAAKKQAEFQAELDAAKNRNS